MRKIKPLKSEENVEIIKNVKNLERDQALKALKVLPVLLPKLDTHYSEPDEACQAPVGGQGVVADGLDGGQLQPEIPDSTRGSEPSTTPLETVVQSAVLPSKRKPNQT